MKEMDIEFLRAWFQGFEAGLEGMDEAARRDVLAGCARQCARSCPLKAYKEIWAGSRGDLHRFFRGLGRVEGISVQEAEPGISWRVIYPACGCDLVTGGLVRSPAICQCLPTAWRKPSGSTAFK